MARSLNLSLPLVAAMLAVSACSNPTESDATCRDEAGNPLNVAPQSARVDLKMPKFSNSKTVTNPLFPIARLDRALLLGNVDGVPLRVETTLLVEPHTIEVDGEEIETLASQYVAWMGGRIAEVAIDLYAQGDDGSVWYFVRAALGSATFTSQSDGLVVESRGSTFSVEIAIPRLAPWVEIQVAGERVVLKDGVRVTPLEAPRVRERYRIALTTPRK